MKVRFKMVGDKINTESMLSNLNKMVSGTTAYVESYPVKKDFGIFNVIDEVSLNNNNFQIIVKNKEEVVLGKGEPFRSKTLQADGTVILGYNINQAYFNHKEDFYIVELYVKGILVDKYELRTTDDIYDIYDNQNPSGLMKLD